MSLAIIGIGAIITILLAKGYTISQKTGAITGTGILVVSSIPDGASVLLDGHLTAATDSTVSYLEPRNYTVKITKEGYFDYQKAIEVKKELVTKVEALLFPRAPSLSPMTFNGAINPVLSPSGTKIAWGVDSGEKAGLWVADLSDGRILLAPSDPKLIIKNTPALIFSKAKITWAPDSKNLLVSLQENQQPGSKFVRNYILDTDRLNERPNDATLTLSKTIKEWQDELIQQASARTSRLDESSKKAALAALETSPESTASAKAGVLPLSRLPLEASAKWDSPALSYYPDGLHWSPGENKFFYQTRDGYVIYDTKEKKQYILNIKPKNIWWLPESPDSNHLILIDSQQAGSGPVLTNGPVLSLSNGQIDIIEADGQNKTTIYSGNLFSSLAFPWPNGSRLIILTNFNAPAGTPLNLYTISLR